jgi:hypothetical protein
MNTKRLSFSQRKNHKQNKYSVLAYFRRLPDGDKK